MDRKTVDVEVFIVVDEQGQYLAHEDYDTACERAGEDGFTYPARVVKVIVTVPLPQPLTLRGTCPAEVSDGASLTVEG